MTDGSDPGLAVVIGASGGIGGALVEALAAAGTFASVIGLTRAQCDLTDETSLARAAESLAAGRVRLLVNAAGILHEGAMRPEKTYRALDPAALTRIFAVNAVGPALVLKHFLPRLPRAGRSLVACLSARVGSIGDNRLGGWYGYRASKAALNQLVRTAAIELARTHPEAICVALHPGTVATRLSAPFAPAGGSVLSPPDAARALIQVMAGLTPGDSGGFFDWRGARVPW